MQREIVQFEINNPSIAFNKKKNMDNKDSLYGDYLLSSKFQIDKNIFKKRYEDIENGKAILLSSEEYEKKMDIFIKKLESKFSKKDDFIDFLIKNPKNIKDVVFLTREEANER